MMGNSGSWGRLYPPVSIIVRQVLAADRLAAAQNCNDDRTVVLHRHRRRWECPEAFDGTRFLPAGPGPVRLPAPSGGIHEYIDAPLVLTEATLVLAEVAGRSSATSPRLGCSSVRLAEGRW
jgi:cytochrome P450